MNPEIIKRIGMVVGAAGVVAFVSIGWTKKACDRANKAFLEKHDEQMAIELTMAFNEAIRTIPLEIKRSTSKFKKRVNDICAQPRFNIDPVFV